MMASRHESGPPRSHGGLGSQDKPSESCPPRCGPAALSHSPRHARRPAPLLPGTPRAPRLDLVGPAPSLLGPAPTPSALRRWPCGGGHRLALVGALWLGMPLDACGAVRHVPHHAWPGLNRSRPACGLPWPAPAAFALRRWPPRAITWRSPAHSGLANIPTPAARKPPLAPFGPTGTGSAHRPRAVLLRPGRMPQTRGTAQTGLPARCATPSRAACRPWQAMRNARRASPPLHAHPPARAKTTGSHSRWRRHSRAAYRPPPPDAAPSGYPVVHSPFSSHQAGARCAKAAIRSCPVSHS